MLPWKFKWLTWKEKNKKQQQSTHVIEKQPEPQPQPETVQPKIEEPPKKQEEEEELPDLNDRDVQKATFAIQNAYKKRMEKLKKSNPPPQSQPEPEVKKEEPEEELPDLNDPGVQNATFAIQKAYKNRINKLNLSKAQPQEQPKPQVEEPQKQEEEEELPNIEDPDVQKATLAIQKAYKKRINLKLGHGSPIRERVHEEDKGTGESNSEAEHEQEVLDQVKPSLSDSVKRSHMKPHTVPGEALNSESESPDSKTATRKQDYKTSWRNHRSYTGEIPKIVIHTEEENSLYNQDVQEYIQTDPAENPYVEFTYTPQTRNHTVEVVDLHNQYEKADSIEEDGDLPDLEDPDVQKAAASIQKAYFKRINKKAAV